MRNSTLIPVLALSLVLACCSSDRLRSAVSCGSDRVDGSLAALKNTSYSSLKVHPGPVLLTDGRWEGQPYVEGGAARPSVQFVADLYRTGKVAGSQADAAVVFLAESSGGSGTFLYLALVEKKNAVLVNTATVPVGDRVQIRDVRIENGTIIVDVLQAGPQDAACCPGELATRRWQWESEVLVEAAAQGPPGRLTLDVMAGPLWRLREWDFDQPAPDEPQITLVYEDGRFSGSAGCNRYFTPVTAGESPGALRVGLSGSTRMMCPETIMDSERRFLNLLGGARKFGFVAGRLALIYETDGRWGSMAFERSGTAK